VSRLVHITDMDKTKLSYLVCIGGVNTIADKTRQFCLVRIGSVNKLLVMLTYGQCYLQFHISVLLGWMFTKLQVYSFK